MEQVGRIKGCTAAEDAGNGFIAPGVVAAVMSDPIDDAGVSDSGAKAAGLREQLGDGRRARAGTIEEEAIGVGDAATNEIVYTAHDVVGEYVERIAIGGC